MLFHPKKYPFDDVGVDMVAGIELFDEARLGVEGLREGSGVVAGVT